MKDYILVAIGGALGACGRYGLTSVLQPFLAPASSQSQSLRFPWTGTWIVNVLGCLFAGALLGLMEKQQFGSAHLKLFLFTGILGGFTTFSAFGVEFFQFMRRGDMLQAGVYVFSNLAVSFLALWLAFSLIPHRTLP